MALNALIDKIKNLLISLKKLPGYILNQPKASQPPPVSPAKARRVSRRNNAGNNSVPAFLNPFLERFPIEKRKPLLFGLCGFAVLFLVLLITGLAVGIGKPEKAVSMASGPFIPVEDLFIPAEPDYVPDFIPEREPRSSWSLDDIRPYWRSPGNSEYWRREIKSVVDKLMEGVQ